MTREFEHADPYFARFAAIEERWSQTTPGPWLDDSKDAKPAPGDEDDGKEPVCRVTDGDEYVIAEVMPYVASRIDGRDELHDERMLTSHIRNAAFISHAWDDVRWLMDRLVEKERELADALAATRDVYP